MYKEYKILPDKIEVNNAPKREEYPNSIYVLELLEKRNSLQIGKDKLEQINQLLSEIPENTWHMWRRNIAYTIGGSAMSMLSVLGFCLSNTTFEILLGLGIITASKGIITLKTNPNMKYMYSLIITKSDLKMFIDQVTLKIEDLLYKIREKNISIPPLEGTIEVDTKLENTYRMRIEQLKQYKEELLNNQEEISKTKILRK